MSSYEHLFDTLRAQDLTPRRKYWCCEKVPGLWSEFASEILIAEPPPLDETRFLEYQRQICEALTSNRCRMDLSSGRTMKQVLSFLESYLIAETDPGYLKPILEQVVAQDCFGPIRTIGLNKHDILVPRFVRPEYVHMYLRCRGKDRGRYRRRLSPVSRLRGWDLQRLYLCEQTWESEFFRRPHTTQVWWSETWSYLERSSRREVDTTRWAEAACNWLSTLETDEGWRGYGRETRAVWKRRRAMMPTPSLKLQLDIVRNEFDRLRTLLGQIARHFDQDGLYG